jgi:hypothetical protein
LFAHVFILAAAASVAWRWLPSVVRNGLIAFLLCVGLYVHSVYWNELKIGTRPGLRGMITYVLAHRASDEPLIVVHPMIFHAVRYYTQGIVEPKLFVDGRPLRHYNAGAIVAPKDFILAEELEHLPDQRIWVLDTTGFQRVCESFPLATPWQRVPESAVTFPEVFAFQREVTAVLYERSATVGPTSPYDEKISQH